MKRFFVLSALALLLASSFVSLFEVSSASAQSVYDNVITTTDKLEIASPGGSNREDVSATFVTLMSEYCDQTGYDNFINVLNNDGYWTYLQYNHYQAQLIFTQNSNNKDIIWHNTGVGGNGAYIRGQSIYLEKNASGNVMCYYWSADNQIAYIGYDYISPDYPQLYLSTYNPNYPPGYQGKQIPETALPPLVFVPDYTWSVDTSGRLRVSYQKNAEINLNGYGNYRTFETAEEWADPRTLLDQKVKRPFWQYTYEYDSLPDAGYYSVVITYEEGDWEVAPPDFTYVGTVIFRIYWDGESFIQGNNAECTTEDGFTICNNLEGDNTILKTFKSLSVDNYGLQSLLMAPINFIAGLPAHVNNCTPITLPLMGTNQQLPCPRDLYQQSWMSTIWTIWQTVVTAAVTYYVGMRIFKTIKDVNTPHNDGIEVAKL